MNLITTQHITFEEACRQFVKKHRKFFIEILILLALVMSTFISMGTVNGLHYESKDLDHVVELARKADEEQEEPLVNVRVKLQQTAT